MILFFGLKIRQETNILNYFELNSKNDHSLSKEVLILNSNGYKLFF
jgi:hypothetical protein